MIIVHHLENSRSQRIIWLLEELALPYEVKRYDRDSVTNLAPPALLKVHPLGKSPVIEDDGKIIAETGTIIEHIVDRHGGGKLKPAPDTDEYLSYKYWMHAAEGSYMPPLVMALLFNRMETAKMPFFAKPIAKKLVGAVRDAYLDHTTKVLFDYADATLKTSGWFAGPEFSAADIIMSFPMEASQERVEPAKNSAAIVDFVSRIHARPAYIRALEKGGPYAYA